MTANRLSQLLDGMTQGDRRPDGTVDEWVDRDSPAMDTYLAAGPALVALVEQFATARSMALDGAARQHLDRSGVYNDPPHGMGKFAECEAPWCIRNQEKLAKMDAALADLERALG